MKLESRWLVCGMCSAFALAFLATTAFAQTAGEQCSDIQMLQHKCGQQQQKSEKQAKLKTQYPNASRKQPAGISVNKKDSDALNAGIDAANKGDSAGAQKILQPLSDSNNAYVKAKALQVLGQVKYNSGDIKGAIAMEKQAIDSNALDNDSYFQGLETLAQMYIADEDYSEALATLDTWNKESGAQSADIYAAQGNAYYRMQKYPQAVAAIQKAKTLSDKPKASWDQIEMASDFAMDKYDDAAKLAEAALAKDPNNSTLLQTVIAIYINAHQDQKALALLERARANGQIKDQAGYLNMASMYDNLAQNSSNPKANAMKAVGVLREGMSKGVIQPGYDSYKLLGESYNIAGDYKNAADAYGKAAPAAKTGEVDFKRGVMLEDLGQHREARDALKQAIAKGNFKRMGAAYLTLGNAELALKDKAAARAAYEQAEQDPETRADAQRTLKQLGHK
jgi:predicted Zn-dependent protease